VIALDELNKLPTGRFVATLQDVFEHSKWVPERAAIRRPFSSRLQLLDAMRAVVLDAPATDQISLINAHPRLGDDAQPLDLSASQGRLPACSEDELAHLERINATYAALFGFPFVLDVGGHDPQSIIAEMERRVRQERSEEVRTALHEIGMIAGYRLAAVVTSSPATEIRAMLGRLPKGNAASLAWEWMRAAGMNVFQPARDVVVGVRPGTDPEVHGVLLGIDYDPKAKMLAYRSQLGWVSGIAVAQQLKEQGVRLIYDLAVAARISERRQGDPADIANLEARRGCVLLESVVDSAKDDGTALGVIRQAGLENACVPNVNRGAARVSSLEQAMRTLYEFVVHTKP
jgi:allantoate deiminase/N-carbamoyl-L-amino-acid hydrolase